NFEQDAAGALLRAQTPKVILNAKCPPEDVCVTSLKWSCQEATKGTLEGTRADRKLRDMLERFYTAQQLVIRYQTWALRKLDAGLRLALQDSRGAEGVHAASEEKLSTILEYATEMKTLVPGQALPDSLSPGTKAEVETRVRRLTTRRSEKKTMSENMSNKTTPASSAKSKLQEHTLNANILMSQDTPQKPKEQRKPPPKNIKCTFFSDQEEDEQNVSKCALPLLSRDEDHVEVRGGTSSRANGGENENSTTVGGDPTTSFGVLDVDGSSGERASGTATVSPLRLRKLLDAAPPVAIEKA
ncbi:unnamed protein product, partial [Amoebophrya sp. A25]